MKTDNTLDELRKQIDSIDNGLVSLLAKRMEVVRKIRIFKKQNNLRPLDPGRWTQVLETILKRAESLDVSPNMVKKIWNIIHEYALKIESL